MRIKQDTALLQGRERRDGLFATGLHDGMSRQIRRQVCRNADRPHAWATTAVRNRKRPCEVRVTDVRADGRRAGGPTCAFMFAPSVFFPGHRGRESWRRCLDAPRSTPCVDGYVTIRHDRRSVLASAFAFRSATSMLPSFVLATTTTQMPAIGTRRIGAVRRGWNQHDVAMQIATIVVIRANDHQACELTLRAPGSAAATRPQNP